MGAGCLFCDDHGRVLLVKPTYKPVWEIPGGVVEQDESPKQCCQREILEEIGLVVPIGAVLVVDYNEAAPPKTESLMFIFDGGTLTPEQIAAIRLPASELSEFHFFPPTELPTAMSDSLRKRVLAAWQNRLHPRDAYLENQQHIQVNRTPNSGATI